MKKIHARETQNGWEIEITDTRHAFNKSDVLNEIRENGLEIKEKFCSNEYIYAE